MAPACRLPASGPSLLAHNACTHAQRPAAPRCARCPRCLTPLATDLQVPALPRCLTPCVYVMTKLALSLRCGEFSVSQGFGSAQQPVEDSSQLDRGRLRSSSSE